jgi:hypothetical protein
MRWSSSTIGLVVVAALVGLGLVVDALNPAGAGTAPAPAVVGPARSGAAICAAAGAAGEDRTTIVTTALPVAEVTDTLPSADVTVDVAAEGLVVGAEARAVSPGSAATVTVPAGIANPVVASRWFDVATAVHRSWAVGEDSGVTGRVEGPCPAEVSDAWVVPGLATAGGATAAVVLANPFTTDASVSIAFTTPDGPVRPRLLENIVVQKGSVRTVSVNEHAPEQPDLGAMVTTRSGRVVVEATQQFDAAIGGVEGIALAPAVASPAETWTIPWFTDGPEQASWLWLTNPDDRPAAVAVTLHTADGGLVPEGIEELTLAPGSTRRVDLRGLLGEGGGSGGVTVRTDNGVGIAVSVATQLLDEGDVARTGIGIGAGAQAPSTTWVAAGGPTAGRTMSLTLVNPSAEPAVVDVAVWTPGGVTRPLGLQGIEVPAGAYRAVSLGDTVPEAEAHALVVTTSEGQVVVGTVGFASEGPLAFAVAIGSSVRALDGGEAVAPVRSATGLTQRLGTVLGPRVEDPFGGAGSDLPPRDADPLEESVVDEDG